jgi:hypothetical protein
MEKNVEASAWRESVTDDGLSYRLQINNVTPRLVKKIEKACANWRNAGYGWNLDSNYKILIFAKRFKNQEEWLEWAKQFPYKLVELNSKGNPKPSKLGVDFLKKQRKKRK